MKKVIISLKKIKWHVIIHITFLNDAIDRLLNNELMESDLKILKNSSKQIYDSLIFICNEEVSLLFPALAYFMRQNDRLLLEKEHIRISEILNKLKRKVELIRITSPNEDFLSLKSIVNNLGKLLSLHLEKEDNIFYEAINSCIPKKELPKVFNILEGINEKSK